MCVLVRMYVRVCVCVCVRARERVCVYVKHLANKIVKRLSQLSCLEMVLVNKELCKW